MPDDDLIRKAEETAGEARSSDARAADLFDIRRIIGGLLGQAGVAVAPRIETNSTIVLIAHVLAGGWATILPLGAAELFLREGPLRAVPLDDPDARHRVGLIAPAREPQTPLVSALLSEAKRISLIENSYRPTTSRS